MLCLMYLQFVKRAFQEDKARQIFRKTNISYPLIHTYTCAYQGVRNVSLFRLITDEISCSYEKIPGSQTGDYGSVSQHLFPTKFF